MKFFLLQLQTILVTFSVQMTIQPPTNKQKQHPKKEGNKEKEGGKEGREGKKEKGH